jgi:hypothetical protein
LADVASSLCAILEVDKIRCYLLSFDWTSIARSFVASSQDSLSGEFRRTLSGMDLSPNTSQIGWFDKQNVCRQNIPLKQWNIEGVFQPEMKGQAKRQQRVAKLSHPNQDTQAELQRESCPASQL